MDTITLPMTFTETMAHPDLRVHEHKFEPGTPYWHEVGTYCEHGENCGTNDADARDSGWLRDFAKGAK